MRINIIFSFNKIDYVVEKNKSNTCNIVFFPLISANNLQLFVSKYLRQRQIAVEFLCNFDILLKISSSTSNGNVE